MSSFRCDSCRKTYRTAPHRSMTGRLLCDRCHSRLLGATAGAVAGGTVATSLATAAATEAASEHRRRLFRRRPRRDETT